MAVVRDTGIPGELGVVARLLVDPAARRRGLGARLLEHARAQATGMGRTPVLDVAASAAPAVSLYRASSASGWKELGRCELVVPGRAPMEEILFAAP